MSRTFTVGVKHVTRVEGHGNILLDVTNGSIERLEWQIPEAPRFFEAMIRGRTWQEVHTITSRICGICSISHTMASVRATERAMGIELSAADLSYRELMHYSEQLQSHTLHIGYLVAPDLFGVKSVIPLVSSHPDAVKVIIRAHRIANEMSAVMGGRITHPVTVVPGGFTQYPTRGQLLKMKGDMEQALADFEAIGEIILSVADRLPAFQRDTEYVGLYDGEVYPFYKGMIGTSDAEPIDDQDYRSAINEYVSPQSTAKFAKWHRDTYAVGALARFNLNSRFLMPRAKKLAKAVGLVAPCTNPFFNSVAQLVECAHMTEDAQRRIDEILTTDAPYVKPRVTPRAGNGAGVVEAPRGLLIHEYTYDKNGICQSGNCVIPTNQNHANIQADFEALVPAILDKGEDEITLALEMLVRSYDPCISCSTHYLDVQFKR